MLLLMIAAQLSLPLPIHVAIPDLRAIFTANDFPADLQMAGVSRTVRTRTTVRPDGSIQSCIAEGSSGDAKLDAYTCGLIVKRAKFSPAKWIDGSAVYGVIRVPIRWLIEPIPEKDSLRSLVPDLDVSVNRLPDGAQSIVVVSLEIAADDKGHPVTCIENPVIAASDHKHQHFPELVALACQEVLAKFSATPPIDASGTAARSIQSVTVRIAADD